MLLVYGGEEELVVRGYADVSFQTDRDDCRSQSGFVYVMNGGAVSWMSSKQDTVAESTTEVEYIIKVYIQAPPKVCIKPYALITLSKRIFQLREACTCP